MVTDMNTVVSTLQGRQLLPTYPLPKLTSLEQQDFDCLLNTVFDATASSGPTLKLLDDRKQERVQKALEYTENLAPQESTRKKQEASVDEGTTEKKEQDISHKKEKTQSSNGNLIRTKRKRRKQEQRRKLEKGRGRASCEEGQNLGLMYFWIQILRSLC